VSDRTTRTRAALAVGAVVLAALAGVAVRTYGPAGAPEAAAPAAPRVRPAHPNVLIVLWDTTRADHLTVYGHDKPTTPNLARWAEGAVVFEQAISPAMWTVPSHASLFTGTTSTTHNADYDYRWLDGANVTLAEWLGQQGYDTYAFSANPNLADNRINLLQGVSRVEMAWRGVWKQRVGQLTRRKLLKDDASTEISPAFPGRSTGHFYYNAAPVTGEALGAWLDQREDPSKPFFAYLNYMEAHKPRVPSLAARQRVARDEAQIALGLRTDLSLENQLLYSVGAKEYSPDELAAIEAVYDASLTELDDWTGRLFDDLRQRGLLEDTIVVFTSDHGENLGDHHLFGHRHGLYQALVHVPLVIAWEGHLAPKRVTAPTSNLDLFYTISRLAGFEPPAEVQANFRTDLLGGTSEVVFSETIGIDREGILKVTRSAVDAERWMHTFQSVIQDGWKLISTSKGTHELYHLAVDPDELQDLSQTEPARLAALQETLKATVASIPRYDPAQRKEGEGPQEDDAATRAQLAMLGYLEEGDAAAPETAPASPAPAAACTALSGDAKLRCQRIEAACGPMPEPHAGKCRAAVADCDAKPAGEQEACLRNVEAIAARFQERRNQPAKAKGKAR
jgi:arylsulfatase A-like enzyme